MYNGEVLGWSCKALELTFEHMCRDLEVKSCHEHVPCCYSAYERPRALSLCRLDILYP